MTADPAALAAMTSYPCVMKPLTLSASRGVMRADDAASFVEAFERLRALLASADVRAERAGDDDSHAAILIEGFIEGWEFALEGIMHYGALTALALFDKPDPLDGPFFEETIYVTPSSAPEPMQWDILDAVSRAAAALGLKHGPVHAECRVNDRGVYVLEVAARPIGGLCAKSLRFQHEGKGPKVSLEELLLRHALGESPDGWRREAEASSLMMIPIPRRRWPRRREGGAWGRRHSHYRQGGSGARAAARGRELPGIHLRARPDRRGRGARSSRRARAAPLHDRSRGAGDRIEKWLTRAIRFRARRQGTRAGEK